MNILVTLVLVVNLVTLLVLLYLVSRLRGVRGDIAGFVDEIRAFVSPVDDKTPSPLAATVEAMSEVFSRTLIMQAKAVFMGKQSGEARASAAIEADIAESALAEKSPMLSMALNAIPGLKKSLRKHPELIDMAIQKFASNHTTQPVSSGGNGNGKVKFSL
jgi:hypothetical protein